jgi:hypothetical protein
MTINNSICALSVVELGEGTEIHPPSKRVIFQLAMEEDRPPKKYIIKGGGDTLTYQR